MTKLRSLDIEIAYTGSIIKTFEEGRLGNFLKILASEYESTHNSDGKNESLSKGG